MLYDLGCIYEQVISRWQNSTEAGYKHRSKMPSNPPYTEETCGDTRGINRSVNRRETYNPMEKRDKMTNNGLQKNSPKEKIQSYGV